MIIYNLLYGNVQALVWKRTRITIGNLLMDRETFLSNCYTVDFETTGLEVETAEIVEQGVSAYAGEQWIIFNSTLHNSEEEIPPEASGVNNITSEMVKDEPLFTYDQFASGVVKPGKSILVSHNANYDSGVLEKYADPETFELLKSNWICTLKLIRKLYVNDTTVARHDLSYLRYRFKFDVKHDIDIHRAGYDSYLTGLLLEHIIDEMIAREELNESKDYLEQLADFMEQPVLIDLMPFGKHTGEEIKALPTDYLKWAKGNMDKLNTESPEFDPDLAVSMWLALEERYQSE
jgi:DNA polymerase-3 subunit epsilon